MCAYTLQDTLSYDYSKPEVTLAALDGVPCDYMSCCFCINQSQLKRIDYKRKISNDTGKW